jgi:predicted enzyme related to lactoylglutathione lyase
MDVLASRILLRPSDFGRSRRFYGETLGLAVFREWEAGEHSGVVFYAGGGLLEVSGHGPDAPSPALRLLFEVRDVDAEWRRLEAAGAAVDSAPEAKPWGLRECTVLDPDGVEIVLVEVPDDHPRRRAG